MQHLKVFASTSSSTPAKKQWPHKYHFPRDIYYICGIKEALPNKQEAP